MHQNRSVSLFSTPFDHFHFHALAALKWWVQLRSCRIPFFHKDYKVHSTKYGWFKVHQYKQIFPKFSNQSDVCLMFSDCNKKAWKYEFIESSRVLSPSRPFIFTQTTWKWKFSLDFIKFLKTCVLGIGRHVPCTSFWPSWRGRDERKSESFVTKSVFLC